MVVQIALSLVLLVSTGLFVRTLGNLQNVDAGFNRHGLILFRIDATSAGYTPRPVRRAAGPHSGAARETARRARGDVLERRAPVAARARTRRITVPGYVPVRRRAAVVNTNGLAPNFFAAMELPLVLGRGFTGATTSRPRRGSPSSTRRSCAPTSAGENPVGRRIGIGPAPTDQVEIVGVARRREVHRAPWRRTRDHLPAGASSESTATRTSRCAWPRSEARRGMPSSRRSEPASARSTRRFRC